MEEGLGRVWPIPSAKVLELLLLVSYEQRKRTLGSLRCLFIKARFPTPVSYTNFIF